MREIKFRAFDNSTNRMIYSNDWYYQDDYWNNVRLNITFNWSVFTPYRDKRKFDYHKLELMQYTWLKDKNWKEIYELDIVINHITGEIVEIIWDELEAGFCFFSSGDLNWSDYIEIIWNIYENPELLNK